MESNGLRNTLPTNANCICNPDITRNSNNDRSRRTRLVAMEATSKIRHAVSTASFSDSKSGKLVPHQPKTSMKELGQEESQSNKAWTDSIKLTRLPKFYPLERTTARINPENFVLQAFMQIMAALFRVLSIHVYYCTDPPSMSLLTPEFIEIHVALWLSRNGKEVLVEVQRRRGDSITFHKYAQYILDTAISGNTDSALFPRVDDLNLEYLLEAEKLLTDKEEVQDRKEGQSTSLEVIHSLLTSDRVESLVCGMEGLCVLTDARKTGVSTASIFGRVILFREAAYPKDNQWISGIREAWFSALGKTLLTTETLESNRESSMEQDLCSDEGLISYHDDLRETSDFLFNKALTVLLNALELLNAIEKMDTIDCTDLAARSVVDATGVNDNMDLLSTLVHGVDRAEQNPHDAFLCAKCLALLGAACGTQVLEDNLKVSARAAAKRAHQYGRLYHEKLERGCHELLQVLY